MVKLLPVLSDPPAIVAALSQRLKRPLSLHSELDVDVYRVRRTDGCDVVARAFGPHVPRTTIDAAAHVLEQLAHTPFPAERCAFESPVASIADGCHLLLTEYVEPQPAPSSGFVLAWCSALLGRLATKAGSQLPPGGGWHRLGATPSAEIQAALDVGGRVGTPIARVLELLADADDAIGLPEALIHADLTPANAVPQGENRPVIIDWIGAGRGPRLWPLAFLLFTAGPRLASRSLARYSRCVSLTDDEMHRLPSVMIARPLTLDIWSVANGRMTPQTAVTRAGHHLARVAAVTTSIRRRE